MTEPSASNHGERREATGAAADGVEHIGDESVTIGSSSPRQTQAGSQSTVRLPHIANNNANAASVAGTRRMTEEDFSALFALDDTTTAAMKAELHSFAGGDEHVDDRNIMQQVRETISADSSFWDRYEGGLNGSSSHGLRDHDDDDISGARDTDWTDQLQGTVNDNETAIYREVPAAYQAMCAATLVVLRALATETMNGIARQQEAKENELQRQLRRDGKVSGGVLGENDTRIAPLSYEGADTKLRTLRREFERLKWNVEATSSDVRKAVVEVYKVYGQCFCRPGAAEAARNLKIVRKWMEIHERQPNAAEIQALGLVLRLTSEQVRRVLLRVIKKDEPDGPPN